MGAPNSAFWAAFSPSPASDADLSTLRQYWLWCDDSDFVSRLELSIEAPEISAACRLALS